MFNKSAELRGHGETIEMTKEQMDEYIKCSKDIFYFCKYFYIIQDKKGAAPIELREYQERIVKMFIAEYHDKEGNLRNNRIITLGRQGGKTTICTLYILWYALFNKDKEIAVLANKEQQAKEIMQRIRAAVLKLPLWLQPGINPDRGGWSKESIGFDNGCKIFCAASGSSAIRGRTVDLMLVDEFAFLPPEDADDFIKSVFPTQSSRSDAMLILISTPHGMNQFYNIWQKAIAGINSFVPAKVQWYEIPGRDEAFKQKMIRDLGIQTFQQEYACITGDEMITVKDEVSGIELTDKISSIYELWQDGFLK